MSLMKREREEHKPLLAEDADMFEGLSFPEPPSAPPVIKHVKTATVPFKPAVVSSYDTAVVSQPSRPAVASDDIQAKSVAHRAPPAPAPAVAKSQQHDFKSLYITETRPVGYLYPSLPDDRPVERAPPTTTSVPSSPVVPRSSAATSVVINAPGGVEMQPWGKRKQSSADTSTTTPSAPTVVRASAPPSEIDLAASANIVQDILQRNAHPTREGVAATGPVVTGLSTTERAARATPVATSTRTSTGSEIASATNPPKTQKYVCCGSCKQWLSAPIDATLVYCPGCEAVNDCSLAEATGNRTAPRRLEQQPWYLSCFQRFLS